MIVETAKLIEKIDEVKQESKHAELCMLYRQLSTQLTLTLEQILAWSNAAKSLPDLALALSVLDMALSYDGLSPEYFIARGKIFRDQGKLEQALSEYKKALSVNPGFSMTYCQMGIIYEIQKNLTMAEECYLQALSFAPENGMYWLGLAKCLQSNHKENDARSAFAKAEKFMQHETDYNKACLYTLMGDTEKALVYLSNFCRQHAYASEWASQDPDLNRLRELPEFPAALNGAIM